MRIEVYDDARKEWRDFEVVPADPHYQIACGNGLHQLHVGGRRCACGKIAR